MGTAEISTPFGGVFTEIALPARLLAKVFSPDMAMDLGTANTLIYVKGQGIVVNEPSVVAVEKRSGKLIAVGHVARDMYGKAPQGISCIRPMKDGVIADFDSASLMIRALIGRAVRRLPFSRPRMVIGVPSGITQVEKRAVIEAALASGVRDAILAEEPMAAALGSGLPVTLPIGSMIVDIGGGTTEVAVITNGQTLYSHSIRVAGDEMDEAIQRFMRKYYGLEIGIIEAERIKLVAGSALAGDKPQAAAAFGRGLSSGMPQQVEVSDEAIREALDEPIEAIISSIVTALEQISTEIAKDIVSRGVYLAGGGSLLRGLADRLHQETGIRFVLSQDPLSCVVRGVGKIVEDLKHMKVLCIS